MKEKTSNGDYCRLVLFISRQESTTNGKLKSTLVQTLKKNHQKIEEEEVSGSNEVRLTAWVIVETVNTT